MKRTTSMTEFTLEIDGSKSGEGTAGNHQVFDPHNSFNSGGLDQSFLATSTAAASPLSIRRNLADSVETAHFLRACSLCKRRLIPGRDIYMYRYIYINILLCTQILSLEFLGLDSFLDVKEVMNRLPREIVDARNQR
ncbi:Protein of unknown function (DUF581) [Abeliophyllum distichum]|uniref:FLZ-type domain-containing protein n=1 Tax=Abeliophyllum distichum TaxID=126358 RepID=A0ABD1USI4_9LAMI